MNCLGSLIPRREAYPFILLCSVIQYGKLQYAQRYTAKEEID